MTNLIKKGGNPYFTKRRVIFALMVIFSPALKAASILSAPSASPDISGVWAMLAIGLVAWFFCAKGMPKDMPRFDSEGYLIDEEGGNQNV